jgi:hypothetical protein
MSQDPKENLVTRVITKAWEDDSFKKALLSDPKAAIAREFGVEIGDEATLQVHEETADTVHLILPPRPQEGELSDEQLDSVAGGMSEPFLGQFRFFSQPMRPRIVAKFGR